MNSLAIRAIPVENWRRGAIRNGSLNASLDPISAIIPVFGYALKPILFPEHQACSLASKMRGSIAAQRFEMNRVLYAPRLPSRASVIGASRHPKAPPAMPFHLRHEWKAIQLAVNIEARDYFG